ncbi:MAG: M20/M25/M40 family metallo-hydrolase [Planctomycetia bacterium]|nr:M20/M25/M40 family metallo-hydrolase [Planctomycetia bacterium]
MKVKGRTGHSSGIFGEGSGAGAIFETARALDELRRELSGRKGLSFNASLVLGGTTVAHEPGASSGSAEGKSNVIPGESHVLGDLRFLTDAQCDAAEATLRAVVARSLPKTSAEVAVEREYPAMAPTPGNYAVLGVLDRVSRDLGLGGLTAFDPVKRGAGDISFVAPLVDGLDGLGTGGGRSHTPEEWVDLDTIPAQIKRAALLIGRLTHDETGDGKAK